MTFILGILIITLIIYLVNLTSRITKLERLVQSGYVKPTSAPASSAAQKASSPAATAPAPARAVVQPAKNLVQTAPKTQTPIQTGEQKTFIDYLPKVGVIALLFGIGFFLKYAIDQGWISVSVRLIIGAVVGALMIALYSLWKEKYRNYSLILAGGGLGIWFLTIYASVEMYGYLSVYTGMAIMCAVSVLALYLSYRNKSEALSMMAIIGAYLAPMILSLQQESYIIFLGYLLMVSIAVGVIVLLTENLKYLAILLIGVVVNFILADSTITTTPEHFFLYTIVFAFLHLGLMNVVLADRMLKSKDQGTNKNEYALLFAVSYLVFGLGGLYTVRNEYVAYSALVSILLSVWTFIIYAVVDRLEDKAINYLLSGIGAALLLVAAIWQFSSNSQIIAVYALGFLGLIVGFVRNRAELRVWGLCEIAMGIVLATLLSYPQNSDLFFTAKFGLEALGIASLGVSYFFFKEGQMSEFENDIHRGLQYAISILIWFFVTWDIFHFFSSVDAINQRNLLISIWWLAWAVILMAGSLIAVLRPLRKIALILFGLVIVKVFLYDVANLEMAYRIISFISLGAILLIVSFVYQHNKEKIKEYLQ